MAERAENVFAECNVHNMMYEKRRGTGNEGANYEIDIIALFSIRLSLDENVENFLLASNVNNCGAFDDVVIKVRYKNGTTILYLLQLKHKKNWQKSVDFINKANGDFSLEKYKDSYHRDIKGRISGGGQDDLLKDMELKNVVYCLFTNAVFPEDKNNITLDKRASLSCKALCCLEADFIETTPGGRYIFQMHTERPSFTQFLKPYLFSGYQKGYEDRIKKIEEKFRAPEVSRVKQIAHCFRDKLKIKVQDEMNFDSVLISVRKSVKELFKEVEGALLEEVVSKVSDYFCLEYQSAQKVYEEYAAKCAEYSEFFQRFRFYGGQLSCKQVSAEVTSRIERSLGKCKPKVVRKFLEYVQDYFQDSRLLVKQQIQKKLLELMLLPLPLSKEDFERRFEVFRMVTDLNDPTQKLMVSQHVEVALQGRKRIGLCDIVDSSFCQNLKAEFLLDHMGDVVHVGRRLELKCEHYIKRKFGRVYLESNILRNCSICIFILSVSESCNSFVRMQHQANVIDLRNGQDLPRHLPSTASKNVVILISNKNGDADKQAETLIKLINPDADVRSVHYLNKIGDLLEWRGSRNVMAFEEQKESDGFIPKNKYFSENDEECLKEEDLLQHFTSPINIISAEPGMGKSTVLDSLIQYCPSNKWVLKLSLNEWNDDLHDKFPEILRDPLQYIYEKFEVECKDEFSKEIFGYLKNKRAVMVFIDAFDEISPNYTEKVLKLIHKLLELEASIWVFTRPTLEERLEKDLKTAAIRILPLTEDQIKTYLLKSVKTKRPSFFQKMTDFMKLPLHLNMFSTILCNDLNWDELHLTDLYENFINTKCVLYYKKFGINLKINCVADVVVSVKNLVKNHQVLSLLLIYGDQFLVKNGIVDLSEIERLLREIKEYKNHVGLISVVDGSNPIFCHRSYAEYLTARWLSSNTNHETFGFLYGCLFESSDLRNVRFFFDKILTREYPLHAAVIDGNLNLVRQLCHKPGLVLCDSLNRTPLHLAMSCFKHSGELIRENQVACKIMNEICERFSDAKSFVAQRDFLGHQWYEYSAQFRIIFEQLFYISCFWGCKAVMMMYLAKREFPFLLFPYRHTAIDHAIREGHIDCLKLLLAYEFKVFSNLEEAKKLTTAYSQALLLIGFPLEIPLFTTRPQVIEYLWKNFEYELVYMLKFLIVNEVMYFDESNYRGFPSRFGYNVLTNFYLRLNLVKQKYFSERTFNRLLEETKKKFEGNLEELEEHFGMGRAIKEKLNVLERVDVITKMQLSGCTPLCAAAFNAHLKAVKLLAGISGNVNANPGDKFVPLHCAIEGGNIKVIMWLIKAGANVNQVDSNGNTALTHYYKIYFQDYGNRREKMNFVKQFIDNGADATTRNSKGRSCFGLAVERSDLEIVKLFTEGGVCVDYKDNGNEFTPLHKAIDLNQHDYVKYFLSKRTDMNIQVHGKTSLDLALDVIYRQTLNQEIINRKTVTLLMKSNAEINCYKRNLNVFIILICVVEEEWYDLGNYLVEKIADVIVPDIEHQLDFHSWFRLHTTKPKTCDCICKLLNEHGKRGRAGLLLHAFNNCDAYLAKLFIDEGGGDVKEKQLRRRSFFQKALAGEHWATVKLFVESGGVNIDYVNKFAVLHKAIKAGQQEYVKYFLDKGADVNFKVDNMTPLDLALGSNVVNRELVRLLVENGADINRRQKSKA